MDMRSTSTIQMYMIELLQEPGLSAECIAKAAELIATYARFNFWIGTDVKKRASKEEILEFVVGDDELDTRCRLAVATFKAEPDEATLRQTLSEVITKYNELFTR
jgi:hypothetical protein